MFTELSTALAFLALYLLYALRGRKSGVPLPPGPPRLPIVGNLLEFPRVHQHFKFTEWAHTYGDVVSAKVMDKTVIILNSATAIRNVIDKRSLSSAGRPHAITLEYLTPNNSNMATNAFADATWKKARKGVTQILNPPDFTKRDELLDSESAQLVWQVLHDPKDLLSHVERCGLSISSSWVYGTRFPTRRTKELVDYFEIQPQFLKALELGTPALFPFVKYIPGLSWKRHLRYIKSFQDRLFGGLLSRVENRLKNNQSTGVLLEEAIQDPSKWGLERSELLQMAAAMMEGSETSAALVEYVIAMLVMHPKEQEKVIREIDSVVESSRLPTKDDIENLPQLRAFVEETLRDPTPLPMALPHAMLKDEIIDGYLYPKGAAVFMNNYGVFHDERFFEAPFEFRPDRFIKHPFGIRTDIEDEPGRRDSFFWGGGRRICPGMVFGRASLLLLVLKLIWAFKFSPEQDKDGNDILPDLKNARSGIIATLPHFDCKAEVRTPAKAALIDAGFRRAAEVLRIYELEISDEDREWNTTNRDTY